MKLTRRSTLADVAAAVGRALEQADIPAVLTGGACATFYSKGAYSSVDLDFILRGGTGRSVDEAMAKIGFVRRDDRYVNPSTPFFVEFPRGPLAIGEDFDITPVTLRVGGAAIQALSPTDACRDRLAAFYHWADRQSLEAAVAIATRHRVTMATIARWSAHEGYPDKFEEFRREVGRRRKK